MTAPDRVGPPTIDELRASYAGPLFVYAVRRLGDRDAAEEVVQDTLLAAWRHAHRYDPGRGTFVGWLFAIAHNVTIDHRRRSDARPDVVPLTDTAATSSAEVDRALDAWQLAQALAELSDEHRDAIVDVHYLGFTVREVAARRDLPEGTVKSRIYYGLRALRLRLEEMGVVG